MMSSDSDDGSSQGVPAREGWTGNGRRKRDAPDREVRAEHQLVSDRALSVRDKQVHLPTWIVEMPQSIMTFVHVLAGMTAQSITSTWSRNDACRIKYSWPTGHLGSEDGVDQLFNDASERDVVLHSVRNTVVEHNGARATADQDSHPRNFMILNVPKKVKSTTKSWWLHKKGGEAPVQIKGTMMSREYLICNWEREDADVGTVNRVGEGVQFSPQPPTFTNCGLGVGGAA